MRVYLILLSIVLIGTLFQDGNSHRINVPNQNKVKAINTTINRWHRAAANADFDTFFNCMDEESYYIGTDETEKWNRKDFMVFCKPYFDQGSAWDFKPFDRGVYLNKNMDLAWFDEKLDTWMGICRASGVVVKSGREWKIKHYHLSVTIPNDIVDDFIKLVVNYKAKAE